MARVKISEYKAKQLLLGDSYHGIQLRSGEKWAIPRGRSASRSPAERAGWVAKVDQGVKKRMKQGLVAVNVSAAEIKKALTRWEKKGFTQFVLEPFVPHAQEEEQYLSLERVRGGVRVLHASEGGIDIEAHPEKVHEYVIRSGKDISRIAKASMLPRALLERLYEAFTTYHFAFLEVNPLVVQGRAVHLLDAAVLVDSAGEFFVHGAWSEEDIVRQSAAHDAEKRVEALAATTPAALTLTVLNPNGALFLLLSGGGGSIVIADEAQLAGAGESIANYGEYSGGPTREETYLYAKEIVRLLIASKARKKALVIAGGIANFTDVRNTFLGIIDALSEECEELARQNVRIFVRRGGPHERDGLALMETFLEDAHLLGAVHGSEALITTAIDEAIAYTRV